VKEPHYHRCVKCGCTWSHSKYRIKDLVAAGVLQDQFKPHYCPRCGEYCNDRCEMDGVQRFDFEGWYGE
jgi:hypothetical protein